MLFSSLCTCSLKFFKVCARWQRKSMSLHLGKMWNPSEVCLRLTIWVQTSIAQGTHLVSLSYFWQFIGHNWARHSSIMYQTIWQQAQSSCFWWHCCIHHKNIASTSVSQQKVQPEAVKLSLAGQNHCNHPHQSQWKFSINMLQHNVSNFTYDSKQDSLVKETRFKIQSGCSLVYFVTV